LGIHGRKPPQFSGKFCGGPKGRKKPVKVYGVTAPTHKEIFGLMDLHSM